VPASDLEGESSWPTQPVPVKPPPFVRQAFTGQEITDLSPAAHEFVLHRFQQTRGRKIFTPPSREGTIVFPGFHGGANWSGASFDPAMGRLYVNANEIPWILTMREAPAGSHHRFVSTGYNRFLDPEGFPAVKPPWGTLTSIDLNRGAIAWQRPLGEYPELRQRGVPPTGTENFGGSIVTAGGLVFIVAPGEHVLAFRLERSPSGALVLMFAAVANEKDVGFRASPPVDLVAPILSLPDGSWRCSTREPPDEAWTAPGYNDSAWSPMAKGRKPAAWPLSMDAYWIRRLRDLGAQPIGIRERAPTLWVRKVFALRIGQES
jgi:hypothetical protein